MPRHPVSTDHAPAAIGPVPDLSVYYHVDAPVGDLADLAEELAGSEGVQAAYVKPASEPPVLNDMAPAGEDAPGGVGRGGQELVLLRVGKALHG